jgi:hypothetical protein
MFIHPMEDDSGDEDDPLVDWEKRQEYRAVQFQWLLITGYVAGLALFVAWLMRG